MDFATATQAYARAEHFDRLLAKCGPVTRNSYAGRQIAEELDEILSQAAYLERKETHRETVLVRSIRTKWPHHWGSTSLRRYIKIDVAELRELRASRRA